ncbi:hypothetical protein HPB49_000580 [Dermacentor silvarum]|uniref:Uncharacterized protein n=1 Tax=Dermacentor silvarum TaxID=543639 RepID=A0ACB8DS52_DERSI|nr:hypothetical protein HPB49_000580 [Dermacentor silvarum]
MLLWRQRALWTWIAVLAALSWTCGADEARAPVVDSASRGHHEAVPPDPDDHTASTDDVIVSPIHHHGVGGGHAISAGHHGSGERDGTPKRFQVAKVDFHHVATPFIISVWIIIAGFAKIGTRLMYASLTEYGDTAGRLDWVSSRYPSVRHRR